MEGKKGGRKEVAEGDLREFTKLRKGTRGFLKDIIIIKS